MNVDDPSEPIQRTAVVSDASTVYASPNAVYLADNDNDYSGERRETTFISKLDLREEGAVLVAAGRVPGRLLNRFSLSEHEGHLRVATTTGHVSRSGDGDASSHVYVLTPDQGELAIVGRIEDIAPTERIYSARFLGDRGFLVTFKKVDPLFTLDLSEPTDPRVVGELKIPGYSDYIHPLGPNHLLTIGKDTIDAGGFAWYQGVQISLFDISDFANPHRVDAAVIGARGTESEALRNPHAFNYFSPAGILAVPIKLTEGAGPGDSQFGQPTFTGLYLLDVDAAEGIQSLGRIATSDAVGYSSWGAPPTRGVFIGDYVYAVTTSVIRAVPVDVPDAEPTELLLE